MNATIHEFKPSLSLSPYIELFWQGDFNLHSAGFISQTVVPNGYVELIIHLTDAHCELLQRSSYSSSPSYMLIGLFTKTYDVHFKSLVKVFGIRFKPESLYSLFRVPAYALQADYINIDSLSSPDFIEYCNRLREKKVASEMISLSEEYFLQKLNRNKLSFYYLNQAAEIIRKQKGLITIEELADKVCVSTRQLEREFKSKLGINPKQYMRIARLNEVNRLLQSGHKIDLSGLAYTCGYADQAHFSRDFKSFVGERPSAFIKERERFISHSNVADQLE